MRRRRMLLAVLVIALVGLAPVPVAAQGAPEPPAGIDPAEIRRAQEQAAERILAQLGVARAPMAADEIEGMDQLGPAPWLSFGPSTAPCP